MRHRLLYYQNDLGIGHLLRYTMVRSIHPKETRQYQYLRVLSPVQLYREGSRHWIEPDQPNDDELLVAYTGVELISILSDATLALLGKSGIIQLATHIVNQSSPFDSEWYERGDVFAEVSKQIVAEYDEKELKQAVGRVVLLDETDETPDHIDEIVEATGFLREEQIKNESGSAVIEFSPSGSFVYSDSVAADYGDLNVSEDPINTRSTSPIES